VEYIGYIDCIDGADCIEDFDNTHSVGAAGVDYTGGTQRMTHFDRTGESILEQESHENLKPHRIGCMMGKENGQHGVAEVRSGQVWKQPRLITTMTRNEIVDKRLNFHAKYPNQWKVETTQ